LVPKKSTPLLRNRTLPFRTSWPRAPWSGPLTWPP